jgi:hypothetical protein
MNMQPPMEKLDKSPSIDYLLPRNDGGVKRGRISFVMKHPVISLSEQPCGGVRSLNPNLVKTGLCVVVLLAFLSFAYFAPSSTDVKAGGIARTSVRALTGSEALVGGDRLSSGIDPVKTDRAIAGGGSALHAPTAAFLSKSISMGKVGNSVDGVIKRLPDQGMTTCYALDTKKLPEYAAGDSVSLTLSADGPTVLSRLPDYEPRQARFPVAQGGLYYQLFVGDQVVFWGQTGTPGVVAFDTPPQTSEADQLRIHKTLSANATAAIQLPPTTGKAILRVWAVNYETNLENGLGVPLYSIDVPASPGS